MESSIARAINHQIKEELYSAYLYQAMAAYCAFKNLDGFANWFDIQAKEEMDHARGFYNYLLSRGGKIILQEIQAPPINFKNPTVLFEESLKHEKFITGKIHDLYKLGEKEKDYAFMSFLKWYIDEQVEEEETASKMIEKITMLGEKPESLYLLDKELGLRTYKVSSIIKK